MAGRLATRRQAEAFARALAAPAAERDARYADLAALVDELAMVPARDPDPAFVASLRTRLMAEADEVLVPVAGQRAADRARLTLPERGPRKRERRTATLLAGLAFAGAAATVGVVAQASVPGDFFYPVKRGVEDARTGLSLSEASQGRRLLAQATERLAEAQTLVDRDDSDAGLTTQALTDFTDQATAGAAQLTEVYEATGDPSTVRSVTTFTAASIDTLAELAPVVPAASQPALQAATDSLLQIDDDAVAACPDCGGPGITSIPVVLQAIATTSHQVLPAPGSPLNAAPSVTPSPAPTLPSKLPLPTATVSVAPPPPGTTAPPATTAPGTPQTTGATPTAAPTTKTTKKPTPSISLPVTLPTSILPTSILPSVSVSLPVTLPTSILPTSILPSVSISLPGLSGPSADRSALP